MQYFSFIFPFIYDMSLTYDSGSMQTQIGGVDMAERPEDLNLPNSVVSKIIKEAVCILCHNVLLFFWCNILTAQFLLLWWQTF